MPRRTALDALERFRRDGAWSGQVLGSLIDRRHLIGRDAALAARIFYTTLQQLYYLDFIINQYTRGKLEPKVRDILRVGACQILAMNRIPPSAAVSESVKLCRSLGYARAGGLVNAVLRKIAAARAADALPAVPDEGTAAHLSVRYSHPLWMVNELIAERGYENTEAHLRADNETVPVYLQSNTLKTDAESLSAELHAVPVDGVPGCLALTGAGDIRSLPAFVHGRFYVQDPAAHLAVLAADPKPGMRVLDCCAAPGGKSFAAAIAMGDEGHIDAQDISDAKLNLVMDGCDRLGLHCIDCHQGDAREIDGGDYDIVFADLPCSGLGVIRKKPDIRYRSEDELNRLPELQTELLNAVSRAVRPGGRLVYSTCTWRRRENQDIARAFLDAHGDFRKAYERTFWPDIDGTDGFYVCVMNRENEI